MPAGRTAAGREVVVPRLDVTHLPPDLTTRVGAVAERLGYTGEFFTTVGWVPDALAEFLDFTAACKAPLSDRHNEVLALRVCTRLSADYERIQHERLCRRLGLPDAWVLAAEGRAPDDELDDAERDLAALADRLTETDGAGARTELDAVVHRLGPAAAVAATLQAARFRLVATLVHAFALELPVASDLDEEVER